MSIWPKPNLIPKIWNSKYKTAIYCAVCAQWYFCLISWYTKCKRYHSKNKCPKAQDIFANASRGNQRSNKHHRMDRKLSIIKSDKSAGSTSPGAFNPKMMSILDKDQLASLATEPADASV
jgi:hypothetical protein